MAEPPPGGGDPPAPLNQATILAAAMNPYATVNLEEARKQKEQYGADLERTRGALSNVQTQRQDVTTRNLGAIDEAIKGLKESRTGTYGFDPAVSAAMAAGFLKTTPGVTSNFMGELGQAMGNAAPVIKGLQDKDRDSFQILADLQRKRGEFEAQPLLEQQTELSAREKLEFANLKEAEKALARAPKGDPAKDAAKNALDLEKLATAIKQKAREDAVRHTTGKMKADGTPINLDDQKKIEKYLIWDMINDNNKGKKAGDAGYVDPSPYEMTGPERDEAFKLANNTVPDDKGASRDYNEYKRREETEGRKPVSKEQWEINNAADKKTATVHAEAVAKNEEALPQTIETTNNLFEAIDELLKNGSLSSITGPIAGLSPGLTGDQVAAIKQFDRIKAIGFLNAVPQMKGMGQLTEAEGAKLLASQTSLDRRMSPEQFRRELQSMRDRAERTVAGLRERNEAAKAKQSTNKPRDLPSAEHIEMLKNDPTLADFFDKKYGPGAAARVLGR